MGKREGTPHLRRMKMGRISDRKEPRQATEEEALILSVEVDSEKVEKGEERDVWGLKVLEGIPGGLGGWVGDWGRNRSTLAPPK